MTKIRKQEVVNFVRRELPLEELGIPMNSETVFFEDIPLNGLDLDIFFMKFFEEFNIDNAGFSPSNFYLSEYELGNFPLMIFRLLFNRSKLKKKTFKINHLVQVVNQGEWNDPE